MAAAELIGATVGVILLVIVAYILVGSTISTAQTVAEAQKDLTLLDESRLHTDIAISNVSENGDLLTFNVTNTGSEVISDFTHMDMLSSDGTADYTYYNYTKTSGGEPGAGTWTIYSFDQNLHPGELDPGETISCIAATYPGAAQVKWIQVTTGNGVSASAYLS